MYLKRSIRRHAAGCGKLLCLLVVVASASRCTSDSITGGETPGPEVPGPVDPDPVDPPLGVGSVTLSPDSLTVGVEETAQLSVIVRDRNGAVIADPQVVFTMFGLDGTVDSNGLVTAGFSPGVGTVKAWSRGVNSNAAVITVVSEVGSVTLSPDSLTIRQIGGTAQLSVIVRDTTGVVIANPQVSFFGALEEVGTVDSTGLVTGLRCGVGSIVARSRGVNSNVVRVTVLPSSADCSSGSPWGYSRIAFQLDGDIQLVTFPGGGGLVNLTNHPAEDIWPALSPDRSRIVFSSDRDNPAGEFELYSMNVDGSDLVRLTNSLGWDFVGPQAWSPDGSKIAFTSVRDNPSGEIYIMNADGSGVVRLTDNSHSDSCAAWSPDGSSIAFCSGDTPTGIYRMGTTPGSPVVRIASEGFSPDWSPDGSKIAYMTGVCWEGCDIAVIAVNGTGFVQLHPEGTNDNALQPSWSPDGSWIAFTRVRYPNTDVAIVRFEGNGFGEIVRLTGGDAPSWR